MFLLNNTKFKHHYFPKRIPHYFHNSSKIKNALFETLCSSTFKSEKWIKLKKKLNLKLLCLFYEVFIVWAIFSNKNDQIKPQPAVIKVTFYFYTL